MAKMCGNWKRETRSRQFKCYNSASGGDVFPNAMLQLKRERYPSGQESRNSTKSHRTTNSHKRFIGREKLRRVVASALARSSRELSRIQGLYRVS